VNGLESRAPRSRIAGSPASARAARWCRTRRRLRLGRITLRLDISLLRGWLILSNVVAVRVCRFSHNSANEIIRVMVILF
jgi:hypothetical protein